MYLVIYLTDLLFGKPWIKNTFLSENGVLVFAYFFLF